MHARVPRHAGDVRLQPRLRFGVDRRPDMRSGIARIAQFQLRRGAGQHGDDLVRHILLHREQPQRRAALPGAAECAHHRVVHHLFRQRRRIDDHRIDAAGLRDQRHDRPALFRQRPVDRPRHLGRSGEGHACNLWMRRQSRPDRAIAQHQLQRARRHARLVQQPYPPHTQ